MKLIQIKNKIKRQFYKRKLMLYINSNKIEDAYIYLKNIQNNNKSEIQTPFFQKKEIFLSKCLFENFLKEEDVEGYEIFLKEKREQYFDSGHSTLYVYGLLELLNYLIDRKDWVSVSSFYREVVSLKNVDLISLKNFNRINKKIEKNIFCLDSDLLEIFLHKKCFDEGWTGKYSSLFSLRYNQKVENQICLLNDTRTQNNVGCNVTTSMLIKFLQRINQKPIFSLTLSDLKYAAGLLFNELNFQIKIDNFNDAVNLFENENSFRFYRECIDYSSSIVVNGEGSFYDRQEKGLIIFVMLGYAKRKNKKIIILNHSLHVDDEIMRSWSKIAYSISDSVFHRDPISHENYKKHIKENDHENVFLSTDFAFLQVGEKAEEFSDYQKYLFPFPNQLYEKEFKKPFVVLSGTSSIYRKDREEFVGEKDFEDLIQSILHLNLDVVLYAADQFDMRLLGPIAKKMNLPLVPASVHPDIVTCMLSDAEAYISGRWHASILAICAGTVPILGDANFFKTKSLHDSLELPWDLFSFRNLKEDTGNIINTIKKVHFSKDEYRNKLVKYATEEAWKIDMVLNNFDNLVE